MSLEAEALEHAEAAIKEMREVIALQLEGIEVERERLRRQAYGELMEQGRTRQALNSRLGRATQQWQTAVATLDGHLTPELQKQHAGVISLARKLYTADTINRRLLERTLGVVRAFRTALRPQLVAYDRRGARRAFETYASSTSRRV